MSTPTPRTDAEVPKFFHRHELENGFIDFARTLETELTAANARIAELENELEKWLTSPIGTRIDSLTRQLSEAREGWHSALSKVDDANRQLSESQDSLRKANLDCASLAAQLAESQAQLASVKEERDKAVAFANRIERGELHFESLAKDQLHGIAEAFKDEKGIHEGLFDAVLRCKLRRDEIEDQLASAREDSARLDWLEKAQGSAIVSDDFGHWAITESGMQNIPENPPGDIQTTFFIEKSEWKKTLRSAIDSARGVTSPPAASCSMCGESTPSDDCPVCAQDQLVSPPAVAQTGEKDAWQPIETAPKDGRFLGGWWSEEEDGPEWLQCVCRLGKSGMPLSIVGLYSLPQVTKWSALPPPPQGKEARE